VWVAHKPKTDYKNDAWRERHIGIWFKKCQKNWVFLVLFSPLSAPDDTSNEWKDDQFELCQRFCKWPSAQSNASDWESEQAQLSSIVDGFCRGLSAASTVEARSTFLSEALIDISWGWERYFAKIRNEIRGVIT